PIGGVQRDISRAEQDLSLRGTRERRLDEPEVFRSERTLGQLIEQDLAIGFGHAGLPGWRSKLADAASLNFCMLTIILIDVKPSWLRCAEARRCGESRQGPAQPGARDQGIGPSWSTGAHLEEIHGQASC